MLSADVDFLMFANKAIVAAFHCVNHLKICVPGLNMSFTDFIMQMYWIAVIC